MPYLISPEPFRRRRPLFVLLALALFGGHAGAANAEQRLKWPDVGFQADLQIVNGEARGPKSIAMTLFSAGPRLRMDVVQSGRRLSIIVDRKARRMIAISHARRQAVLLPYKSRSDIARLFIRARGTMTREAVETVNGVRTVRYKFVGKNADGDTFTGQVWMTRQGIVVRMRESKTRPGKARPFEWNLTNLQIGPVPAGQFGVPKGYTVAGGHAPKGQKQGRSK